MDEQFKKLIFKFLNRHFPITKVKKIGDKRFKRGVKIDNGFTGKPNTTFYLNDKLDIKLIYNDLYYILVRVFGVGPIEINPILFEHLNLK